MLLNIPPGPVVARFISISFLLIVSAVAHGQQSLRGKWTLYSRKFEMHRSREVLVKGTRERTIMTFMNGNRYMMSYYAQDSPDTLYMHYSLMGKDKGSSHVEFKDKNGRPIKWKRMKEQGYFRINERGDSIVFQSSTTTRKLALNFLSSDTLMLRDQIEGVLTRPVTAHQKFIKVSH